MPKPEQDSFFNPSPLPTAELGHDERVACLQLIRSENVGPVTFRELINHFGGATEALKALPDLCRRGGGRRQFRLFAKADAEQELAAAERIRAIPLFTIEPGYPALLARTEAPPPMIYAKGRRELLNRRAVAIVGSRQCSAAGVQVTRMFGQALAAAGFVVVSGLARGIDRAAHETSLSNGTVAVLAGGIDWAYPPEHADLQKRIGVEGCLVSERPPGFQPRDKDFPRRNRIIAGLVYGVVIVEAAARSGTLVTARLANDLGREVFALPGHPLDPRAEGTNRLIKNGATLVTTPDEVIDALRPIVGFGEPPGDGGPAMPARFVAEQSIPLSQPRVPAGPLSETQLQAVRNALGPAPVSIDALARATGLNIQNVQIALLELDLAGHVARQGNSLVALKGQD